MPAWGYLLQTFTVKKFLYVFVYMGVCVYRAGQCDREHIICTWEKISAEIIH